MTAIAETQALGEPAAPRLAAGTLIAPGYRVRSHLGRGRLLDAYEAWSDERACVCVIKALRPDRHADSQARRRLAGESRLLLRLTHPHIVRAYDLLRQPEPLLVLEALTGSTVARLLHDDGRLAVPDVGALGLHLCSAMHYLHGRGFLHLDLKPSNVVSDFGQAKVIDFSIARPAGPASGGTGTRPYMSPEQARGGELTAAADVWGIGALLYEVAAGTRPFAGLARLREYPQLEVRARSVRRHRRLPRPLADAIDACLEPLPAARPGLQELGWSLEPFA